MVFDSKKELKRWQELRILQRTGHIQNLRRQVPFELLPYQKVTNPVTHITTTERAVKYIADFVYDDRASGQVVVEDAKGIRTDTYKIKRKLMLERYGIAIKEV